MKKVLLLGIVMMGVSFTNAQVNQGKAADLPYAYGFETDDMDDWTVVNAGTGNNWQVSQATAETPEASEGVNYMLYYYHDDNAANSYLFSKGLNLKAGEDLNLKFDYMGTDAWFPEKMEVLIGTAPTVAAQNTQLWINEEVINYPYETASVNFTVPVDGVYYIAFRAFSDPDQLYLSLDNVKVEKVDLATQDAKGLKLSFFPNPVKNILNIENALEVTQVTVFEMSGKAVLNTEAKSKRVAVDMSGLSKGTYMVRVATKAGAKTVKVIKE